MDSKQLKKIRLSMGLNQAEMSKLVGINRRTYKSYELGERLITEDFKRLIYEINNTGLKNSFYLDGKIDYLRIRFQTFDWKTIIDDVLKLEDKPFESSASSRYGYDFYYAFEYINIYFSSERIDMGTLVEFSGKGCRQFEYYLEEQGRDWVTFLKDCINYSKTYTGEEEINLNKFLKFTRLDIALDEYFNSDGNFDLAILDEKYRQGLISTRVRNYDFFDGLKNGDGKGKSIYFGSRNSPIVLNFYEKDLEQADKLDLDVDYIHEVYGFKNRYEVRMLSDYSDQFLKDFIEFPDGENLTVKAVHLINDKLKVYKRLDDGRVVMDTDWYSLMGSYDCYKFSSYPKQYEIGEKEFKWLSEQVLPTYVYVKYIDEILSRNRLAGAVSEVVLKDDKKKMLRYLMNKTNYTGYLEDVIGWSD